MKSNEVEDASVAADAAMAEKHRVACKEIREHGLADFLDWLRERYVLAQNEDDGLFVTLEPVSVSGQRIFEDYFEIDMQSVERFRRRLIDDLQKKANAS